MPPITEQTPIQFSDALPEAVDVAIIGAGIIGTAAAYFLAQRGIKVLLCEKGRVAGEQSSRNWGWVRQQGRDYAELPIMMEANRIWRGLAAETGEKDLGFTESGCLYLIDDPVAMEKYQGWHDLAKQHQLDTRMLSREELQERAPDVAGNWIGGMLTATDGRAEPFLAVPALARAALRLGAAVIENCAVRTIDLAAGKVTGVITEMGRVRADRVLLSAGTWSTYFAANMGVNLPQLSVRSTVARTEATPALYETNISGTGLSLRRRQDGGYTVATGDLAEHFIGPASFKYLLKFQKLLRLSAKDVKLYAAAPKGYPGAWGTARRWSAADISPFERKRVLHPEPSAKVVNDIQERLPKRFPNLKDVKLAEAWAGMIDVTPDAVPTLGPEPSLPGLYLATGLSGHGFGIGPGIGRIMADILRDKDPGHDLSRFRAERFFDGSKIVPGPY